jgi:hypothetical protein
VAIVWSAETRQKLAPRAAADLPAVDSTRILPKLRAAWQRRHFSGDATWIDKTGPAEPRIMGNWIRSLAADGLAPMVLALAREIAGPMAAFEAGLAAQRGWYAEPVGWEALRTLVLGFSPDDRARAMALADADFENGNLASKLCIAHVFFDRPEWAAAVAKQIVEDKKIDKMLVAPLYASLADFDLVAPLLAKRKGSASLLDLVETFGERILDALLALYGSKMHDPADVAEALSVFADDRAAARLAEELIKKKSRAHTLAYFARHPDLAERALRPMAEGRSKAALLARETLEAAERSIANAALEEASMDDVPEALRAPPWLAKKRARNPKLDPTLRIEGLTRPRLSNGKALPLPAVTNLLGYLARSTIEKPELMLAEIVGSLDRRTLAELGWELARHWELRPRKREQWMIDSLVVLADDEIVRRTSPAMKHSRIYRVLGFIGTDAAAFELLTAIARLARSKRPLDARVPETAFEGIAAQRGMSVDELEDWLVPALGVDDRGGVDLDYGARTVRVVFDAHLVPIIFAPNGTPLKALPDKGKNDDAAKVKDAKRRFADLHEDVTVLAERRLATLERGMIAGRTWPYATWKKVWAGHVLMAHLARAVVWQCGSTALRLAEDGSLAGDDDAVVPLADDAQIGVAHPAELGADRVARWTQILADYHLLQPFEQLVRPLPSLGDEDQTELALGPPPKPIKAFAFWQAMRAVGYAGPQAPLASKLQREKPLRGTVASELRWTLTPSAELESVRLGAAGGAALAAVHPIELAETLRDVERAFAAMRG